MGRPFFVWLAIAVLGGAFLSGCGSGGSPTSTGPAASETSTTSAYQEEIDKVVAACKTTVQAIPSLTGTQRVKAEGKCDLGGGGPGNNPLEAAHNVAKEVCAEVINASPLSGAEKNQALAACKKK